MTPSSKCARALTSQNPPQGQNVTQGKRDLHEAVDMFRELSAQKLADPRLQSLVARCPELQQVLAGKKVWPAAFDRALIVPCLLSSLLAADGMRRFHPKNLNYSFQKCSFI